MNILAATTALAIVLTASLFLGGCRSDYWSSTDLEQPAVTDQYGRVELPRE
jgi:hypothetical protein